MEKWQKTKQINYARVKSICKGIQNKSGIYVLTREEEVNGTTVKFAYIGQAKHLIDRLAEHLGGYSQHIDRSLKSSARGVYSAKNPNGWKFEYTYCPEDMLDAQEQKYILEYSKDHQLYNVTYGMQGKGKKTIKEYKAPKGYREGVKAGRTALAKELKHIIDLHLDVALKEGKQNNKVSQKQLEKFWELLEVDNIDN